MTQEEMGRIVVGTVLREGPSGPLRVVRAVKHRPNGRCWVTLAIRRCSWTRRPTTTINATDLRCRKFSVVPVRPVTLKGEWNERLNAQLAALVEGR